MDELQVSILSTLKELADEYGITFSHTDNCQFVFFTKVEAGFMDAGFLYYINWEEYKVSIPALNTIFEIKDIKSYTTLLLEVIS